jgi:leucyl/phenylalanyl-tRNA---protein transferase
VPPIEPPPSPWDLDVVDGPDGDLVAVGADLLPGTLLAAYRRGMFPMGTGPAGAAPIGWWSPDPRGVLPLAGLRVSRSLARSTRKFEVRVNTAFDLVVGACADPARAGSWITEPIRSAYASLHRLGWAHSVECWQGDRLVGGLYGVAVGGLFAGESMFHHERDASKVALVALVERLVEAGHPERRLLDVQWRTEHLATLGVVDVRRRDYRGRLAEALTLPTPLCFDSRSGAPGPRS